MPGQIEQEYHKPRHCHKRRNLRNRFEVVKTLGQGTYGKVKLAIERDTGIPFAIKSIKKKQIGTEQDLQRLRREIEIMTHLDHPHIISVFEVFENSDKIILIMEYASGGELYDYCNEKQGLYDDEARKFFRQIISAVHYLHMNGIVHRDLKLENIVLDYNGDCKIADFGFANICQEDALLHTFCGSPLYASPEIVNGLPYHGPEVDCWSLGVLLYAMVYGAMPFDGSNFRRLRNQITAGEYFPPNRPSDAEDLIADLLCPNANRRATIGDIITHWWVNLGYQYNPVDDTAPGKPVDSKSLLVKLVSSTSVNSTDSSSSSHCHKSTNPDPSQCPSDNVSLPAKGILKPPKNSKNSSPGDLDSKQGLPCLRRSRSLDVGLSLLGSWPLPSSHCAHDASLATNVNQMPAKAILQIQQQQQDSQNEKNNDDVSISALGCDLPPSPDCLHTEVHLECYRSQCTCGKKSDGVEVPIEKANLACYDLSDIEAVLDGLTDSEVFDIDSEAATSSGLKEDSGITGDISSIETSPALQQQSISEGSSPVDAVDSGMASDLAQGSVNKKKGILKNRLTNPTWRLSTGSQGSSSSTDLLNFSYDSTDGENLLTEYFSIPLTFPMVDDDSVALEMAPLPDQVVEEEEYTLGPPPPLPSCPPPPPLQRNLVNEERFGLPCKNDEIMEKILQLGNQDTGSRTTGPISSRVIDWCEVEDIYRKALELHNEWS